MDSAAQWPRKKSHGVVCVRVHMHVCTYVVHVFIAMFDIFVSSALCACVCACIYVRVCIIAHMIIGCNKHDYDADVEHPNL